MEATAKVRHLRVTPMKARRVVDLVRGTRATDAVQVLRFSPHTAAVPVRKLVESANQRDLCSVVIPSLYPCGLTF